MNINFTNNNNILEGSLTMPKGEVKYGLVLLHSSERSHRNEDYFKPLAEFLAEHGIATLRYDSPGSGNSQGNAFLQSFIDRKNEAISAIKFIKKELGDIEIVLSGLSEGAAIALMASNELKNTHTILVSLEITQYSVERLLSDISNDTNNNEKEIFLCELWFDFLGLKNIDRTRVNNFITKYDRGPWTNIVEVLDKPLSLKEKYELTLKCYKEQKNDFSDYQYMDYFIMDVINNELDLNGFIKNIELWKEFVSFNVRDYINTPKSFLIWGEEDNELNLTKEYELSQNIFPERTKRVIYKDLDHGLSSDNGYSKYMFNDIKNWILKI